MASARYTLNIQPEKPEEQRQMTQKEKLANFWYYNKWYLLIGLVAAVLLGFFIYDRVSQVYPDYTVGVLAATPLPDAAVETLQTQLAAFGEDVNGDGKVVVELASYTFSPTAQGDADPYGKMAAVTRLTADVQSGTTVLYLVQTDLVGDFQEAYGLFAYNDGQPATGETAPVSGRFGYAWSDCPALAQLALGEYQDVYGQSVGQVQDLMQPYTLVRGVPREGQKVAEAQQYEQAMRLCDAMTAGAKGENKV